MGRKKNNKVKEEINMIEENVREENLELENEVLEEVLESGLEIRVEASESGLEIKPEGLNNITVEEEFPEIPEPNNEEIKLGKVNTSMLNVRKEASKTSEIVNIISKDTTVKVLEELDEFFKVRLDNETEGYCVKDFITIS